MVRSKRFHASSLLVLLALSAILPLSLFAWSAQRERGQALLDAEHLAVRTVSALEEHAARVLDTHDLIITEVVRAAEGRPWDEVEADRGLWIYLSRLVRDLDQVAGITVLDERGRVRMTTAVFPVPPDVSFADKPSFRFFRDSEGTGTRIGTAGADAFYGGIGDTLRLSRGLAAPDGSFAGIVRVSVPLSHFTAFWKRFAPTVAHVIPLVRSDGSVLARYPAGAAPGRIDPSGPLLSRALVSREGSYRAVSQLDGVERINAFARIKDYPLHIAFSIDVDGVLAAWRARMLPLGAFSALASAALVGMTLMAMRQLRAARAASERWQRMADLLTVEMAAREKAEADLRRAQTLEAMGQLTAGVSHDFNNLLQAIKSGLFLLRKRVPPSPDLQPIFDASLQAVDRGAKLVRQLMVFARREKLDPRPVDLHALVAGTGDLLEKAVGSAVRIDARMENGLRRAMVDPTGVELALLNLALNARDAMEGRRGAMTIAARDLDVAPGDAAAGLPPGAYVALSLSDTGAGMAPEVLARALEPFFTTKPVGKGTGLGLSMVHGFVSQSGGAVRIESKPGRGTNVSLVLPAATGEAAANREPVRSDAPEAAARRRDGNSVVLLVDDDALGRMATAAALRELGHEVLEARDGSEGLAALERNPRVEMMVTDYAMPGINGAELAVAARQRRPGLPVVMITGYAAAAEKDLERVVDVVLRKPFRAEDLDARVRDSARARKSRAHATAD